jgi:hypothetical protein
MAAGLGFKDFTTGEVLTAADVDGYLMQGVWVFADSTARDAAVTSPQEGNFAYLKDTNVTTYYTGSTWANLDTTGMTNPMTTTGDTIYSSSGSTPARLGIGTAGQVLQVNSGATAPEWATPSSGGMTLLTTHTLSGSTSTISGISGSYKKLYGLFYGATNNTSNVNWLINPNGNASISTTSTLEGINNVATTYHYINNWFLTISTSLRTDTNNAWVFEIDNYTSATNYKPFTYTGVCVNASGNLQSQTGGGGIRTNSAITSLDFVTSAGTSWQSGTVLLYGVS